MSHLLFVLWNYYKDLNHCVYHLVIIAGIITGMFRFKKLTTSSRIFLLLLVVTLFTELLAYYCAVTYHDNRFVYNPFNVLQFALICTAFYIDSRVKGILFLFLVFALFVIVNMIFYQPFLRSSNSNSFLVEYLFTIVVYFIYLVQYFKMSDQRSLKSYPLFWIGLGWLLFSISAIVALGFNQIVEQGGIWDGISDWVKRIANYLLYLSFIIAFLSPQKSLNAIRDK